MEPAIVYLSFHSDDDRKTTVNAIRATDPPDCQLVEDHPDGVHLEFTQATPDPLSRANEIVRGVLDGTPARNRVQLSMGAGFGPG